MSEKTLKFNNIRVNKLEFRKSKQSIDLKSVNVIKQLYPTNLSIVTMALNILLVIRKMKFLNCYVLSYFK